MAEEIKRFIDPDLNMVIVEAFNEFQEGTVIEPTRESGFTYLDIIRDVFVKEPPEGWTPDYAPTEDGRFVEYSDDDIVTELLINDVLFVLEQAHSKITEATSVHFQSVEAQSLLQQATNEYNLASQAFYNNDFSPARQHAQNATSLISQVHAVEQEYQQKKERQQSLLTVGATLVMVLLTFYFLYWQKKRKKLNRQ